MITKLRAIIKILRAKKFMAFSVYKDGSIYANSTDMSMTEFMTIHAHNQQKISEAAEQEDAVNLTQQIVNGQTW